MGIVSIMIVATTILLALITSWALLLPFFSEANDNAGDGKQQMFADLLARKESLFKVLEELEHDYLSGKILEEDYLSSKEELSSKLAKCLEELASLE